MRIDDFNTLPAEDAAALLRACADVEQWVAKIVGGRPYPDVRTLVIAAQAFADEWTVDDVEQALAQHPRIGERPAGSDPSAAAAAREQAGVDPADTDLADALRAGNAAYEARFGRIYLVRAAGRSGPELLALLRQRLGNDAETEERVMIRQLREIAALRIEGMFR